MNSTKAKSVPRHSRQSRQKLFDSLRFYHRDIASNVSTINFVKFQELLLSIPDRGAFGYKQNSRIDISGKIGKLK